MSKKVDEEVSTYEIVKTVSTGRRNRGRTETAQVIALVGGRRVTRHVQKDSKGVWRDRFRNIYS